MWAIIFLAAYFLTSMVFFLIISIGFTCFLMIEATFGKLNLLAPIALFLITPIVKYFFDVFGFPVRLALTDFSVYVLDTLSSVEYASKGNVILKNGIPFTVEPACMGLKLVVTSYLFGLLFISQTERKKHSSFSLLSILLVIGFTTFLVVLTNATRIILLVYFEIAPEETMHDIIGILCFICFTAIPLYYFTSKVPLKNRLKKVEAHEIHPKPFFKSLSVAFIVLICITNIAFVKKWDMEVDEASTKIQIPGYSNELLKSNVVKLESQHAMIYIKPPKPFYTSDHSPFMCWTGSGYTIGNEEVKSVNGFDIYFATITGQNEHYYTAWFHDNGNHKTASQLDWRWRTILGENEFRLVNIAAENEYVLKEELEKFLRSSYF
jgi:exosortase N